MLFRWMFGLPFAALVTAALFFMMSGMIGQEVEIAPQKDRPRLKILADPTPAPTTSTEPPPRITDDPPEIELRKTLPGPRPSPGTVIPDRGPIDGGPIGPGKFSTPVIKIAPQYPEACRSRGAEGDVVVRFDVTPEGDVANVEIVSSADPCFNRTVRYTVAKWKFPPLAGGGLRAGVMERFSFRLVE